jgi:tRNA pseudouridine55 synthase
VFLGEISQVPPIYSAVRVDGKRAYDLARAGKKVEIAPRKVTIHRLGITSFDYPFLSMEIECGTGTYIRSLGQDIARRLSSDAIMINLRRTAIGSFDCQNTIQLDKLNSLEAVRDNLCNPVVGLSHLPHITLDANQLIDIGHGKKLPLAQTTTPFLIGLDVKGNLRSILKPTENGLWSPHRNFEKPDD